MITSGSSHNHCLMGYASVVLEGAWLFPSHDQTYPH